MHIRALDVMVQERNGRTPNACTNMFWGGREFYFYVGSFGDLFEPRAWFEPTLATPC